MMTTELLPLLEGVRPRGSGKWIGRCPAHQDKSPSLTIAEGDRGLLLKCWAGCTLEKITGALGLRISDLFFEKSIAKEQRRVLNAPRLDRRALAFRFELYALDLRLRAECVLQAIARLETVDLGESQQDRLSRLAGSGHDDQERAELFEHVADRLRWKAFQKGTVHSAA
jgi:hypothetical protein